MSKGITDSDKKTILDVIKNFFPAAKMYFFGSRFLQTNKPGSDLDLCLRSDQKLDLSQWSKLEEALAQTDLPYKVDVSDWNRISAEFQAIILKDFEEWKIK